MSSLNSVYGELFKEIINVDVVTSLVIYTLFFIHTDLPCISPRKKQKLDEKGGLLARYMLYIAVIYIQLHSVCSLWFVVLLHAAHVFLLFCSY